MFVVMFFTVDALIFIIALCVYLSDKLPNNKRSKNNRKADIKAAFNSSDINSNKEITSNDTGNINDYWEKYYNIKNNIK